MMTRKHFLATSAGALAGAVKGDPQPPPLYPVPPLARKHDSRRSIDFEANEKVLRFMQQNGVRSVVYGGNAFLYDVTLAEYRSLVGWAAGLGKEIGIIPAVGPSFGRAMDQAPIVRGKRFPALLALPNGNPRDVAGLEAGYREIAEAAGIPLSLYIKSENNLGEPSEAAWDMVARLVDAKVCSSVKYAIVRKDPSHDPYLEGLLKRVDAKYIISGIGERPAIAHLRGFRLNGFTTGSGVLAPKQSLALLEACRRGEWERAEQIRKIFIPLEDMRDAWGPQRVLHAAVDLSGLATTGPIPPFVTALAKPETEKLRPVAKTLLAANG